MRGMFRVLAAASAIALSATGANAALNIHPCASGDTACINSNPPNTTFIVTGNPYTGTDSVSAHLGHSGISSSFDDIYSFIIGPTSGPLYGTLIGTGGGSLTTQVSNPLILEGTDDLDFTHVWVNGAPATIGVLAGGVAEIAYISGVPIYAGLTNTIEVMGTVGSGKANASYGGSATFTPTAGVPEPATWATMLLGFLGIGFVMSRRRRKQTQHLLQLA